MDIAESLLRTGRSDIVLVSLLKSVIIDVFHQHKNIDISEDILSVKKTSKYFVITTHSPLINTEIRELEGQIKNIFWEKLENIGMGDIGEVKLRYH